MHLYTLTRGVKRRVNEWEDDLGAQWMPLQYKMPDGTITNGRIKLAIRVVRLHEIVFPAGYEEQVMSLVNPEIGSGLGKWSKPASWFVKLFGLKPTLKEWPKNDMIHADGVTCMALGTKEDVMNFNIETPVQHKGIEPQENL